MEEFKEEIKGNVEPSRTFPIRRYGTTFVIVLDRSLRAYLGVTNEDVEDGIVALRADNVRAISMEES